jgi:MoaA/NifB/PqqE/SkfB family radical SAM enzyme
MRWYKTSPESDPYHELWARKEWLAPLENRDTIRFPHVITVEPTNVCQNKCLYCSRQLMNRKYGYLAPEIMERISREAAGRSTCVRHGGFGEPLLHPKIVDLIAASKRHGVLTTIFTNGNLLTEDMMNAFIDLGLDEIRFSSSGITPGEHNRVRKNSDYHTDFDRKLEMAFRLREKKGSVRPFLTLYTNVLDYGAETFVENIDGYKDRYLQIADKVDIDLTMFSRVKDLSHVRPLYEAQTVEEIHKPCVTLYLKVIVHWNGDVFCCDCAYNYEEEFFLGNLTDSGFSIEKGFCSEKINTLRQQLSVSMNHDRFALCRACFANTTKWDNPGSPVKSKS